MDRKKIEATFSLSYPSTGGVSVRIRDSNSLVEFVDLLISNVEFTRALSSLQERPCVKCEVAGLDVIGKKKEIETFIFTTHITHLYKAIEEVSRQVIESAIAQGHSEGGWTLSTNLTTQNSYGYNKDGTFWYKLTKRRYV